MKKLEFARVQEGENKLAIEVQKESPVVAVTSQDGILEYILIDNEYPEVVGDIIDLIESELGVEAVALDEDIFGEDITVVVVQSDNVKVSKSPYQNYVVLSTPNICLKTQITQI
jgi:hypothetical protein